jgi:hypothetical protein
VSRFHTRSIQTTLTKACAERRFWNFHMLRKVVIETRSTELRNKGFLEELIAYFPLIRHGRHRKRCPQQFFVAAGTCFPSCCLATIQGYTDRSTFSRLIWHGPHRKRRVQRFFYSCMCIRYRGNVFIDLLPVNICLHTHTHGLIGAIYEVRRWDGLKCHDIHTKFHRYCFRHLKVDADHSGSAV